MPSTAHSGVGEPRKLVPTSRYRCPTLTSLASRRRRRAKRIAHPNTAHAHQEGRSGGSPMPSRCPRTIESHLSWSRPPLSSGPPRRLSIPVPALSARPPTGLPSRPSCRGTSPQQVLAAQGTLGCSRQAGPVPLVYNADQAHGRMKGTGDPQPPTVHNLPGRLDAATPASLPTDGLQELPDTGLRSSMCAGPIEHFYNPR